MKVFAATLVVCVPLAAQTWSSISDTAITTAICPANGASSSQCVASFDGCAGQTNTPYPYQVTCDQVIRAYSGGVARTKAGSEQLIIYGGGHQAYVGNEVYSINLFGTPVAVRLTNPGQYLSSYDTTECVDTLANGQPNSRHTNQSMVYIPALDRVYQFFGSLACATGRTKGDIWYLSFTDPPSWTKVTPNPAGFVPSYDNLSNAPAGVVSAAYDTATAKVYFSHSYKLYSFNPSDSMVTHLSDNGSAVEVPATAQAVIDSTRKNWWAIGEGKAFRISIASGSSYTWTDMAGSADPSCSTLIGANGPSLFYDENTDRFIGWIHNSGSTVWAMKPGTLTCTGIALSGSAPPNGSEIHGLYGRGAYFPTLGKYVVVNDFGQTAYQFSLPLGGVATSFSNAVLRNTVLQ